MPHTTLYQRIVLFRMELQWIENQAPCLAGAETLFINTKSALDQAHRFPVTTDKSTFLISWTTARVRKCLQYYLATNVSHQCKIKFKKI